MSDKVVPVTTAFFIAALDMFSRRNTTKKSKYLGGDGIVGCSGRDKLYVESEKQLLQVWSFDAIRSVVIPNPRRRLFFELRRTKWKERSFFLLHPFLRFCFGEICVRRGPR